MQIWTGTVSNLSEKLEIGTFLHCIFTRCFLATAICRGPCSANKQHHWSWLYGTWVGEWVSGVCGYAASCIVHFVVSSERVNVPELVILKQLV